MKTLKLVLLLLGVAAVAGAGVWLLMFGWDMQEIIGAAQRYDSARTIANPVMTTASIAALSLGAGVLLGLGLGLPTLTRRQIRQATSADAGTDGPGTSGTGGTVGTGGTAGNTGPVAQG